MEVKEHSKIELAPLMGFAFAVHVLSAKSYAYLVTDRESDGHSTGGTWRWLLRRPGEREVPEACREGPF